MKTSRQNEILNLIDSEEITTQEELCDRLLQAGYKVTQATVSRDIRELKLTKMIGTDGKQRYVRLGTEKQAVLRDIPKISLIKSAIVSVDSTKNLIVVKTNIGMAPAVGSTIDSMEISDMLGCIAGDDTILCIMRSDNAALGLLKKINKALNE